MWIVRLALRRPYTFVVASILIVNSGRVFDHCARRSIFSRTSTFRLWPSIWGYTGLSPQDMSDRIIYGFERSITTTVNDIEHIESQSLTGIGIVKVFFQPDANVTAAMAEITAVAQSALRTDPARNDAALPVCRTMHRPCRFCRWRFPGTGLTEQQLFDTGTSFIRPGLVTVHGAVLPNAYGGKQRQIEVDLNTQELQAKGLSASDVVNAVSSQNLILPAGTAKIGPYEYQVDMNESPQKRERTERSADPDGERHHDLCSGRGVRAGRVTRRKRTSCE